MTTSIFNKRLFTTLSKVNKKRKKKRIQLFIQNIKKIMWFFVFYLFFFLLTDCIERKQEAPSSQKEGVKLLDASKQRHPDEGTAGGQVSLSEQPQPPTEPVVSPPLVCLLSAAALTLISQTSHFLAASLTDWLAACADISFSLSNTHSMHRQQTPAQRRSQHTHTFSSRQYMQGESSRNERGVFSSSPAYQCLSGAVIWAW